MGGMQVVNDVAMTFTLMCIIMRCSSRILGEFVDTSVSNTTGHMKQYPLGNKILMNAGSLQIPP